MKPWYKEGNTGFIQLNFCSEEFRFLKFHKGFLKRLPFLPFSHSIDVA